MLTDKQVDAVIKCIQTGKDPQFAFEDATPCEVFDTIIDHLESQQMEATLFGVLPQGHDEYVPSDVALTAEQLQKMFVHHAMHWAFQLGVGAALHAVGQDLKKSPPNSENVG